MLRPWRSTVAALFLVVAYVMLPTNPLFSNQDHPNGDPILGELIVKGLTFDGKLWLLGAHSWRHDPSGALVSFSLAGSSRLVHFESGVIDIAKTNHGLWILREVTVSAWKGNYFADITVSMSPQALLTA